MVNLRQLKIFHIVAQKKNMSAAGRNLHITQPAVSQTIADLETKLGVKLFERLNKRLVLTYAGKVLLEYTTRVLNLVDEAETKLEDIANMKQGKLKIGASMTIGTYLLPEIINQFKEEYSDLEIEFVIDNTSVIEDMILKNDVDIGLIEGPTESADIVRTPFYDDKLHLVCAKNHKWANQQEISPALLKEEDFIIRERGSGTREIIEKTLEKHDLDYNIQHVLNNIEAIKKAVIANLGVSILPKIAIKEELNNDSLAIVEIKGIQVTRKFHLIHHQDKYKSQLFSAFVYYLSENC